jgi:hypothetical protein
MIVQFLIEFSKPIPAADKVSMESDISSNEVSLPVDDKHAIVGQIEKDPFISKMYHNDVLEAFAYFDPKVCVDKLMVLQNGKSPFKNNEDLLIKIGSWEIRGEFSIINSSQELVDAIFFTRFGSFKPGDAFTTLVISECKYTYNLPPCSKGGSHTKGNVGFNSIIMACTKCGIGMS